MLLFAPARFDLAGARWLYFSAQFFFAPGPDTREFRGRYLDAILARSLELKRTKSGPVTPSIASASQIAWSTA